MQSMESAMDTQPTLAAAVASESLNGSPGVYLNTAAEGLFLRSHGDAMAYYGSCKAAGSVGRAALAEVEAETRRLVGDLLGVAAADIAFVASTSRGLDASIKSVFWRAGDNIVLADTEFPTAAFSAKLLETSGVELRIVKSAGGVVAYDDFERAINDRTRMVIVSAVSYKTGQRLNTQLIGNMAHQYGAFLFVDAVQAIGALSVNTAGADFLCAGTFKWMLGAHGLALLYVNPMLPATTCAPYVGYRGITNLFDPRGFGRFEMFSDARRYEEGFPNYLGLCVLRNSLRFLLSVGTQNVEKHNMELASRLLEGLACLGVDALGPERVMERGPIVAFETPRYEEVRSALGALGTEVWARDGRVRMSVHLYNDESDVNTVLEQLATLRLAG